MLKLSAPGANKTLPGLLEPTSVSHSRSMKGTKGRGGRQGNSIVDSDLSVPGIYQGSTFPLQSSKETVSVLFSSLVSLFTWEKTLALKPLCLNSLGKPSMREAFMKS